MIERRRHFKNSLTQSCFAPLWLVFDFWPNNLLLLLRLVVLLCTTTIDQESESDDPSKALLVWFMIWTLFCFISSLCRSFGPIHIYSMKDERNPLASQPVSQILTHSWAAWLFVKTDRVIDWPSLRGLSSPFFFESKQQAQSYPMRNTFLFLYLSLAKMALCVCLLALWQ